MTSREALRSSLQGLLEEEMGEAFPEMAEDQNLREGFGLDSVDVVGLVMRIEREYRIRLATTELADVHTVGNLLDLLQAKLAARVDPTEPGPTAP